MKKFNTLILIFILLPFNFKTKAQEDTVIIENSTESIKESDFNKKRKYKYLDNNFREEKTLIKLGVSSINIISVASNPNLDELKILLKNIDYKLSLEKKIKPSFSIINDYKYQNEIVYWNRSHFFSSDIGFRYYYAMNKRIKNSKGVNNFHSNYLSIKLDDWIKYGTIIIPMDDNGSRFTILPNDWIFNPSIDLSWGVQRRISRYGIVDAGPFIKFYKSKFEFGINLLIGLGMGFKK